MTRRGLVLGCGGALGAAWTIGILTAVEEALDWRAPTAEVIVGTSAGAELALAIGSGRDAPALLAAQRGTPDADPVLAPHFANPPRMLPPPPRPRFGSPTLLARGMRRQVPALAALAGLLPQGHGDATWLAELADHLVPPGDWVKHPATWMVAVDTATGERVAFGSQNAPAASARDAVRASWAVPGWFPPMTIDGRHYLDGGILSPASADLTIPLGLDEIIVIAPMASLNPGHAPTPAQGVERLVRCAMTRTLAAECAALTAAGTRVIRLDPDPDDLRVMGANFMNPRRRLAVLEATLRTAPAAVARAGA